MKLALVLRVLEEVLAQLAAHQRVEGEVVLAQCLQQAAARAVAVRRLVAQLVHQRGDGGLVEEELDVVVVLAGQLGLAGDDLEQHALHLLLLLHGQRGLGEDAAAEEGVEQVVCGVVQVFHYA